MARLFADENFPLPVVLELQRLGHDVSTLSEAGKAGQAVPDEAVLQIAATKGCAVLTFNRRHFVRLHSSSSDHAGIIVCTFDADFIALAHRIHAVIGAAEQLAGQLIRINRPPTS